MSSKLPAKHSAPADVDDAQLLQRGDDLVLACLGRRSPSSPGDNALLRMALEAAWTCHRHPDGSHVLHPSDGRPFVDHVLRVAEYVVHAIPSYDLILVCGALVHDVTENGVVPLDELAVALPSELVHISNCLAQDLDLAVRPDVFARFAADGLFDSNGLLDVDAVDRANIGRKWEHLTRICADVDTRCAVIKLVDNLVSYGGPNDQRAVKRRRPFEIALFQAFVDAIAPELIPPVLRADLDACIRASWQRNCSDADDSHTLVQQARLLLRTPFPYPTHSPTEHT